MDWEIKYNAKTRWSAVTWMSQRRCLTSSWFDVDNGYIGTVFYPCESERYAEYPGSAGRQILVAILRIRARIHIVKVNCIVWKIGQWKSRLKLNEITRHGWLLLWLNNCIINHLVARYVSQRFFIRNQVKLSCFLGSCSMLISWLLCHREDKKYGKILEESIN